MAWNRQQKAGCGIVTIACAAFLAIGLFLAPLKGQICEKDEYTGQKDCASHNVALVAVWETGKFLDDHAGGITGVATAFMAWITWVLVKLAREQSDTTRSQLRAYLSVQIGTAIYQIRSITSDFRVTPSW